MLTRTFQNPLPDLRGFVVHGNKIGRTLGYPTANLSRHYIRRHPIAAGVYAGWASVQGKRYKAAVVIGVNKKLEVHLLDFNREIYGVWVRVELVARLRDVISYTTAVTLQRRIAKDVAETRRLLTRSNRPHKLLL